RVGSRPAIVPATAGPQACERSRLLRERRRQGGAVPEGPGLLRGGTGGQQIRGGERGAVRRRRGGAVGRGVAGGGEAERLGERRHRAHHVVAVLGGDVEQRVVVAGVAGRDPRVLAGRCD